MQINEIQYTLRKYCNLFGTFVYIYLLSRLGIKLVASW